MSENDSYKKLEADLAIIVDKVENSSYEELDDLLKDYDRGIALVERLQKKLTTAKNTIKKAKK